MPALQNFPDFYEQLLLTYFAGKTFKVAFTNTAPTAAAKILADITQISGGNYTAGGYVLDGVTVSRSGAIAKVVIDDEVITASGGSIGPFRYAVVYNDTASGKPLIGFTDRGDSITLLDGEDLTVDFDPVAGVVTLEAKSVA